MPNLGNNLGVTHSESASDTDTTYANQMANPAHAPSFQPGELAMRVFLLDQFRDLLSDLSLSSRYSPSLHV